MQNAAGLVFEKQAFILDYIMKEQASIITKQEDFLLYIIPLLANFPRNHKFLLADKIQNHLLLVLDLLIEAYYMSRKTKEVKLRYVNLELEKTRHLVRLCNGLKIITFKQYEQISNRIDEVGRMNGAWLKSITSK